MELAPTPAFQNLKPIEFEEDENVSVIFHLRGIRLVLEKFDHQISIPQVCICWVITIEKCLRSPGVEPR